MTKVIYNTQFPAIDRDEFLTPFDRMFDQIVETAFPDVAKTVGVKPFQGTAYPKVNVYEYEDKVGLIAEIPGLDKKDLQIEVEDGKLTISGDKHGMFDDKGAKVSAAQVVGKLIADRAMKAGVTKVAFDRSGFKFHGRVAALANAAREQGLVI